MAFIMHSGMVEWMSPISVHSFEFEIWVSKNLVISNPPVFSDEDAQNSSSK